MLTFVGLLAVAVLTLGTGYFVAAEFSFVAVRRGRLEEQAAAGDRRAAQAIEVHRRLGFMLSGAQLGITVTTLVVGFIAEPALGGVIEPVFAATGLPEGATAATAVATAFVVATVGQMVLGELAPKNLAIARAEPVARALAPSMLAFMRLASPLIRLFDGAANRLVRAVGIEPVEELHNDVSVEELDLIVEASAQEGTLSARQAALLSRAVDFGSLYAAHVMVPWNNVVTLDDTATGADLRAAMKQSSHSRFPLVTRTGRLVGVVHGKDLFAVPPSGLATVRIARLARQPLVVPEAARLGVVLAELRHEITEMAVVIDEYGAPAGVVTLEDLAEELVGDIADEHDLDQPGAEGTGDGAWLVPGEWRLDEIERATGIVLPPGDYDTVAGLVLDRLQRLADPGDEVAVAGTTLSVVAVDGWAITRIHLATNHPDTPDPGPAAHPSPPPNGTHPEPATDPEDEGGAAEGGSPASASEASAGGGEGVGR